MDFLLSQVVFSGALNSPSSTSTSYQQLGYGSILSIASLQAPTIDINPSEDILYLMVEPEHLDYIVTVFYDFFCHARFLALDSRAVDNFTTIRSRIPKPTEPLFGKLEELFAVCDPETGGRCEGVDGGEVGGGDCMEGGEFFVLEELVKEEDGGESRGAGVAANVAVEGPLGGGKVVVVFVAGSAPARRRSWGI